MEHFSEVFAFVASADLLCPDDRGIYQDPESGVQVVADATLFGRYPPGMTASETLCRSYLAEGAAMLDRLDGDFAFVIWDPRVAQVFAATDPTGVRPLYFAYSQGVHFSFASDPRALGKMLGLDLRIPESRLVEQLVNPLEILENLEPLVPGTRWLTGGHCIQATRERLLVQKYWIPGANNPGLRADDVSGWVDGVKWHFEQAMQKRLVHAGRLGILLSGGLDSSSALGVASYLVAGQELDTFSLVDSETINCPETLAIKRMNASFRTRPHLIDSADCEDSAERARSLILESPRYLSGRAAYMHLSFAFARDSGVRTIMEGTDADTLFSHGGARDWLVEGRWRELRSNVRKSRILSEGYVSPYLKWQYGLASLVVPVSIRQVLATASRFSDWEQPMRDSLLNAHSLKHFRIRGRGQAFDRMMKSHIRETYGRTQRSGMDNPIVLDGVRRMNSRAATHGVQLMHPFMDRALMDFCAWIPSFVRMRNGRKKWVMRKAMTPYLPHNVAWRADKMHIGSRFDRKVLRPVLERMVVDLRRGTAAVQSYVDTQRILKIAERWQAGEIEAVWKLNSLLLLEHWLQHNRDKVLWGS